MTLSKVYCVTGIDTDVGKTVATGLIARSLLKHGVKVITQKIVQTGCKGLSEDIICHRKLMGVELFPEDLEGITCPYRFSVPCSPHLAAKLENKKIVCTSLKAATTNLLTRFECVVLEGVGGLSVPLNEEITLLDYLEKQGYPLVLVSSPKLGSINHTLNALELASKRNIAVTAIIYNLSEEADPRIVEDSRYVFIKFMQKYGFNGDVIDLPEIPIPVLEDKIPDFYNALQLH